MCCGSLSCHGDGGRAEAERTGRSDRVTLPPAVPPPARDHTRSASPTVTRVFAWCACGHRKSGVCSRTQDRKAIRIFQSARARHVRCLGPHETERGVTVRHRGAPGPERKGRRWRERGDRAASPGGASCALHQAAASGMRRGEVSKASNGCITLTFFQARKPQGLAVLPAAG